MFNFLYNYLRDIYSQYLLSNERTFVPSPCHNTCSGFFPNFCSKIFFPNSFSQNFFYKFFFEGFTLDASPFTETKRTLCFCVMKNMISNQSKLGFTLVWLFFGSYCSHHTRHEKFNSSPSTHNILLYFFQNLLYLIEVLKCFLDGI